MDHSDPSSIIIGNIQSCPLRILAVIVSAALGPFLQRHTPHQYQIRSRKPPAGELTETSSQGRRRYYADILAALSAETKFAENIQIAKTGAPSSREYDVALAGATACRTSREPAGTVISR